jgi:hypothetical protein
LDEIAFVDLGEVWFDYVRSRSLAYQRNFRRLKPSDGRSMHRNSIPHDSQLFLGVVLLSQKVPGGFGTLNLERRLALKSLCQAQVMQDACEVQDFLVELVSESTSDQ